jgi:hypothetical protein
MTFGVAPLEGQQLPLGGAEIDDELLRSLRDAGQRWSAEILVDTRVAVALTVADHEHHERPSRRWHRRPRVGVLRPSLASSRRASLTAGGGVYDAAPDVNLQQLR